MTRRLAALLLAAALTLALVDAGGLLLLRRAGVTARPVPVARLADVGTRPDPAAAALLGPELRGGSPVELMRRVMDLVPKAGPDPSDRLADVYRQARAGGGLLCAGMARLYFNALAVNGYRARIVELRRDALDPYDTHTLVEVEEDGAWHAYDPTFNVAYARGARRLAAEEVQAALKDGSYATIQPVFFGEVRYPARLERYYTSWLPLFNNVYVLDGAQPGRVRGLPPLRYWLGPRFYYSTTSGLSTTHLRLLGGLYFALVGLLPTLILALAMSAALLLALDARARRRGGAPRAPRTAQERRPLLLGVR